MSLLKDFDINKSIEAIEKEQQCFIQNREKNFEEDTELLLLKQQAFKEEYEVGASKCKAHYEKVIEIMKTIKEE